ncbi:MAG: cupin domain-containing protein [Actinomycetota bacterium]|nr:cupin domain-containing protein [Actinomycetota bacterium]
MRHAVIRPGDREAVEDPGRPDGAAGYRRTVMIDERCGSVHMTLGVSTLEPGTVVAPHAHSFEQSLYVLEGDVRLAVDGRVHHLEADDYTLVPLGATCALSSSGGGRWLEVVAPQARTSPRDTFAVPGTVDWDAARRPDWQSPLRGLVGHFTEDQLPPPSSLQMEGYSGSDVTGIRLKMLVDKVFGAQHMNVFMVEFQEGGAGNTHDHPFEEAYVIVGGAAEAVLDGERYRLEVGDVVWTGVGGVHAFFPAEGTSVRWIEVQAPQPPAQGAFRFARQWEHVEATEAPRPPTPG